MKHIIPLRPHHAVCISFFEGKGYSMEFVANMTEVIRSLNNNSMVRLTVSEDQICLSCPYTKDNICDEKARRYDEAVLSVCRLNEGQVLGWQELSDLVNNRIIHSKKLPDICGDCQWNEICQRKALNRTY